MKKRLLIFFCCFLGAYLSYAQNIVVNRIYNSTSATGDYDAIELLVIRDHLDIRNYILKDFGNSITTDNGGKYRFADVDLWKDLRSGTAIVLRKNGSSDAAWKEDENPADFIVDIKFENSKLINLNAAHSLNLTATEMVLIRSGGADDGLGTTNAVHAFATGNGSTNIFFTGLACPKIVTSATAAAGSFVYATNPAVAVSKDVPLVNLPSYWLKAEELMTGFPAGIQVYKTTAPYNGKSMNAYALVFDPRLVEFKPVLSATTKKVSSFYSDEPGTAYACINGGFFGSNASYSLVEYRAVVSAVNIKSLSRSVYKSTANTYYPTRGAFGITATDQPDVSWIYHVGSSNGTIYSYPQPSPNDVSLAPQGLPTATFPSGGTIWNATSAIGGSPVLIKNNTVNITDVQELIVIDNASSRARSAIGHTADGKVIIVAVEGGNANGGIGLDLLELANLMKEMGCVAALNLDGGGSTSFTINGQNTVRPSDGTERAVVSAVIVKSKI
ncbi:phosphodiester glycosidase family protein [Desertivirga xinjiangensis]|uniref:phosphodiester glycosidase family protein n=1 Tax=Desertivirga xinjiangensis TaxID=539206 RepID=UPI0021094C27|nr:phosphodiester glycosidase family protein [Pedobacter xinjiangensis]